METRSLNTINRNTTILSSFVFNGTSFHVRNLSLRKARPLYIVTSKNIEDNIVNAMKIAPIAELTVTTGNILRFSCKPSVNYPELRSIEKEMFKYIQASLKMVDTIH